MVQSRKEDGANLGRIGLPQMHFSYSTFGNCTQKRLPRPGWDSTPT